jgi:glycosyltransferase involved in cell wall biosynthesis
LFKLVDRFLYIGTQNREFFHYYGVSSEQLVYTPYAVDNSSFLSRTINDPGKAELRSNHGIPRDAVVILFSGKYIPKKRPLDVLKALGRLSDAPVYLVMMGEGVLRGEIEKFIDEHALRNVLVTGFVNQSEIGNYYKLSDIFVLPSGTGETWGLVVNEAMLFGLPVIVSSTVGCAADLVKNGENGYVYPEGDIDALANCLSMLIKNPVLRHSAGQRSRAIIQSFDHTVTVDNICRELNLTK